MAAVSERRRRIPSDTDLKPVLIRISSSSFETPPSGPIANHIEFSFLTELENKFASSLDFFSLCNTNRLSPEPPSIQSSRLQERR